MCFRAPVESGLDQPRRPRCAHKRKTLKNDAPSPITTESTVRSYTELTRATRSRDETRARPGTIGLDFDIERSVDDLPSLRSPSPTAPGGRASTGQAANHKCTKGCLVALVARRAQSSQSVASLKPLSTPHSRPLCCRSVVEKKMRTRSRLKSAVSASDMLSDSPSCGNQRLLYLTCATLDADHKGRWIYSCTLLSDTTDELCSVRLGVSGYLSILAGTYRESSQTNITSSVSHPCFYLILYHAKCFKASIVDCTHMCSSHRNISFFPFGFQASLLPFFRPKIQG